MERKVYEETARVEDRHWWFVARRRILARLIGRMGLPTGATILEVGCGSGGNLPMLAKFGRLSAMEYDPGARDIAAARGVCAVEAGALPQNIPFGEQRFDLIAILDVLEHIEDDEATLRALYGRLSPDGRLLITVPAFAFLWSPHDVEHHHFRRYEKAELDAKMRAAGFAVERSSYFNSWLFPLIALVRVAQRLLARGELEKPPGMLRVPPAPINRLLEAIFASEKHVLECGIPFPFGVSLLMVGRRLN